MLTELAERGLAGEGAPGGYRGLVLAEAEGPEPFFGLRSVHHVVRFLAEARLAGRGLEDVLAALEPVAVPGMGRGRSFAVRVHRRGEHGFRSPDLERAYGALLVDRYRDPVDLERPELRVRVDLFQDRLFLGLQLTDAPLSRRYPKVYLPPAALKTTVAYGMLRLAGVEEKGRLLDAFTGSGTIAIEAAQTFPGLAVVATDRSERALAGARANAEAAGVSGRVEFVLADARRFSGFADGSFDWIVANPPFGRRLGRGSDLRALYARFLDQAGRLLAPGGTLAMLVRRRGWLDRLVRERPELRVRSVRVLELGGLYVGLFLIQRRG